MVEAQLELDLLILPDVDHHKFYTDQLGLGRTGGNTVTEA